MKKAAYHVVKEAVDYAKAEHGVHVAGFVNAILRKYVNDTGHKAVPSVIHSFPEWLVKRWTKRFGSAQTRELLLALNTSPEFTLRVNENKIGMDEAIRKLENLSLTVKPGTFLKSALHVDRLSPLINDSILANKLVYIQDEASQLVAYALQAKSGSLVLDACSGVGTKTSNILDLTGGIRLIAMDNSMNRLRFMDRRAQMIQGDVFHSPFSDGTFDAILLDAPCSSLGIIRKHPEIKWRRKEKEIAGFGNRQYTMLKSLWGKLKTGGYLVYSVCSFEPEETLNVIEKFKDDKKFALEKPLPFLFNKEYFISIPHKTGMDGFFIARLKKL